MNRQDIEIITKVYGKLLEHGAASTERITKEIKISSLSCNWALTQMRCKCYNGLWSLPEAMIPVNWD